MASAETTQFLYDKRNKQIGVFIAFVRKYCPFRPSRLSRLVSQSSHSAHLVFAAYKFAYRPVTPECRGRSDTTHTVFRRPDGGTVCIQQFLPSEPVTALTPLLFIASGFAGDVTTYETFLYVVVQHLGWIVVVFHRRGAHCPFTSPGLYMVGNDEDMLVALNHVHEKYPTNPLFCLGYSAGGTCLLRMLGKHRPAFVRGGAAVSSAVHQAMHDNIPGFASKYMLRTFNGRAQTYADGARESMTCYEKEVYKQLSLSVRRGVQAYANIERLLYAVDKEQYEAEYNVHRHVPNITTPFLVLNAQDDVIASSPDKYQDVIRNAPNVAMIVTKFGGHCDYTSRDCTLVRLQVNWAEMVALRFFTYLLQQTR